jgi:hypothetical protein
MKLHSMKLRMSEALLVIQEQDRLIHSGIIVDQPTAVSLCGLISRVHGTFCFPSTALLGRPVAMGEEDGSALPEHRAEVDALLDASPATASGTGAADRSAKDEVLGHLDKMASLQDSDFLPPGRESSRRVSALPLTSTALYYMRPLC